jgi:translation initiation factor IF-2
MGHIDHGKSTLLDAIRKTNITEKEAGGITQHISAYEIHHVTADKKPAHITFLDTPGHEAFSGIRSRGANVADIALLVVSAEDGVKPQTIEAYTLIKDGSIPFIVAITKIDKPSADVDRTKQTLAENEVYVEGYGGNVPVVAVSAKNGEGLQELLDMIVLISELEHWEAERDENGSGVIIESRRDAKKGVTAVGIIKSGTVRTGMIAASQGATAPLRFILNADSKMVEELSFSSPIQIVGWDEIPAIGVPFKTFLKKDEAQEYAISEQNKIKAEKVDIKTAEGVIPLQLIVKADTAGSLEAVTSEIAKLSRERIVPRIVVAGVGPINENDVKTALSTSGASILGFNVKVDGGAASLAERSGISVETFNIIYELKDRVAALLESGEPRIEVEEVHGSAKVLKIFSINKDKQVIGARVNTGLFEKNAVVKILRREAEIGKGRVRELQQAKVAVDSVGEGIEFGTMVESKTEIAPGDMLEAVVTVTK